MFVQRKQISAGVSACRAAQHIYDGLTLAVTVVNLFEACDDRLIRYCGLSAAPPPDMATAQAESAPAPLQLNERKRSAV
ncbi:MAG: hypothetical protein RMK97_10130 [Sutterellaceae bacterium]|nr:hypothetical protein [Burkholderiaceae bacterium]MDW8430839.1 hypothetical protein [Sutterellaceae bacterium]